MKIKHQIPDFYHTLLPSELLETEWTETLATCEDCAMAPAKRGSRARLTYEPDLKCCTFEPFVPNYLAGAILNQADRFPAGAAAMRRKIALREFALPIGLAPRLSFQVEFNNKERFEFGNREDWLCPYYNRELQNCGVWKYRGTVCTTFFCHSNFGLSGQRFWIKFADYLNFVEMALLEEVLAEMAFSPRQVSDCLEYLNRQELHEGEAEVEALGPQKMKELWNGFDSDIEGFYKKCDERVRSFDRERFQEAMGEWGAKVERKTIAQMKRATSKKTPAKDLMKGLKE